MKDDASSVKQPAGALVIVGLGLIGGSIALAAREQGLYRQIVGIGRDAGRLKKACQLGLIDDYVEDRPAANAAGDVSADAAERIKVDLANADSATVECASADRLQEVLSRAGLVVVCTPVSQIADDVIRLAPLLGPEGILTDAGSTKQSICQRVDAALGAGHRFVGSHPLAGSEKSGFEHARADLYRGATCVVTPAEQGDPTLTAPVLQFWEQLGANGLTMSAAEHDLALAMTSHLPHLVASALAASVPEKNLPLAATGFADTTRIAAGKPELWTSIFMENSGAMLQAAEEFQHRLETLIAAIRDQQAERLTALLEEGKRRRNEWAHQVGNSP